MKLTLDAATKTARSLSSQFLKRSSVGKRFALMLDTPSGKQLGGVLGMVDGGAVKGEVIEQRIGADQRITKVLGNASFDPISAQIGTAIAGPVVDWIRQSLKRQCYRLNGSVVHLDLDGNTVHATDFRGALLTELTIPAADPKSNDAQSITIKFQPEFCEHIPGDGSHHQGDVPASQKLFNSRHFRFEIDNVPKFETTKIDALTIKQTVQPFRVGSQNLPMYEPMNVQIPNIVFNVPLQHAQPLFDWHKEFVVEGKNANTNERTASLVFLSPDHKKELVRVSFDGVGIVSMTISKSQNVGGQAEPKTVRVELYTESIDIEFPNASAT